MEFYTQELETFVEDRYADDLNNPYFSFEEMILFPESTSKSESKLEEETKNEQKQ